jgi:hypothetical protein
MYLSRDRFWSGGGGLTPLAKGYAQPGSFSNELLFSIIELIKSVLNSQKRFMLVENESTSLPLSYWQNRGSCF